MSLTPGTRLGPYEILAPIGQGGMGEVYKATDTRLHRDVAIKVSAERFSERFEREARAIAALNHPNICHLYDVGPNYLVMEFVEGESPKGPLPLDEVVKIIRQIADALEAAHDAGIIHRDLKPTNIKVKPDGTVKVLDFGLAKVNSSTASSASATGLENSPTLTMGATQAGVILGTAAYMAPEQARGKAVDKRVDIWAFGVVTYELLTGHRLFEGEDLTDTLAAVVRHQPDLGSVPAPLRRLIEKCLEKDPKKRLRDISGVALFLDQTSFPPAPPQAIARASRGAVWLWAALAGLLGAGLAALAFIHFREPAPVEQAVKFMLEPPPQTTFADLYGGFGVSPDGKYVLFTANNSKTSSKPLWLRPLDSLDSRELAGTEGGNFPTWSPDSKSVAFAAGGKLKRLDLAGGAALTLCDAANSAVSPTGTWNRNGVILFGSATGIQRVSASGGGATLITKVKEKEMAHGYPQFLPDGNRFLYFIQSGDPNVEGVYASSLEDPARSQLILLTTAKGVYVPPRGTAPGYLLYLQGQTLLARRFDQASLRLSGDPVSVAEQVGRYPVAPVRTAFWASDAGPLVYFAEALGTKVPIAWFGRDGKKLSDASPDDVINTVALAPDGERMALERSEAGSLNSDIWIREFKRGIITRLTFDPADDTNPVWSPDGKTIAYSSTRDGVMQIYRKQASGAGADERLTEGGNPKRVLDWSKDGRYLLYREENSATGRDLMALPLEGDRKPIALVNTPFLESTGAFSPDGKWIAYASNDSGHYEIYAQAFPGQGPAGRWQLSNGPAYDVRWKGDGKELYYEADDGSGKIMAVTLQTGPEGVRSEPPRSLFTANFQTGRLRAFEVTADGQRFLMTLNPNDNNAMPLTVVSNWQAGLKK